jgi:hypothetical protein
VIRRVALLAAIVLAAAPALAQRGGDYLTDTEADRVRDAQEPDKRAEVFVKICDRRLLALTNPTAELSEKDTERYGPLPKGSQIDLLDDYRRASDELMEKLDDAYQRKGKTPQLEKALKAVAEGTGRQIKELEALRARLKDPEVIHYLERAVASARLLEEGARGGAGSGEQ